MTFDNDVTQVELKTHMHGLYRAFVKVEGNDNQFNAFRTRLLASMPDEPVNSKVVLVRQWLIGAIGKRETLADTPHELIRLATMRAAIPTTRRFAGWSRGWSDRSDGSHRSGGRQAACTHDIGGFNAIGKRCAVSPTSACSSSTTLAR